MKKMKSWFSKKVDEKIATPPQQQSWGMMLSERDAVILLPSEAADIHSPALEIADEGHPSKLVGYLVSRGRVTNQVITLHLKPVKNQTMLREQKSVLVVKYLGNGQTVTCGLIVKKANKPAQLNRRDGIGHPSWVKRIIDPGNKSGVWRGIVTDLGDSDSYVELVPPPNLRKEDYLLIVGEQAPRNGIFAYNKGAWLQDIARYRIFGSTFVYHCEVSQTGGEDDSEVVEAVLHALNDRVDEYKRFQGIKESIPPLILPTDKKPSHERKIAFHNQMVDRARPRMLAGYDYSSTLDVDKLPQTTLKSVEWEADLLDDHSYIVLIGMDAKPADDILKLFIKKNYVRSMEGNPSRLELEIVYDDGSVERFLLGTGPHEKFASHVRSPRHKVFIIKGDLKSEDQKARVTMMAKPFFD